MPFRFPFLYQPPPVTVRRCVLCECTEHTTPSTQLVVLCTRVVVCFVQKHTTIMIVDHRRRGVRGRGLCYRVLKETGKCDILDSMSMKVGPDFLRALADELEKLSGLTAHITSLRLSGHEVYLASEDDAVNGKQYTVIGITDKVKTGGNLRDMSLPPTVGGQVIDSTFRR